MDEAVAEAQLARLCDELTEILPELGEAAEPETPPEPVVAEDSWEDEVQQDDGRIVALLARRAAE